MTTHYQRLVALARWQYLAGIAGIVSFIPIFNFLDANRHSLQLLPGPLLVIALVFFAIPLVAMVAVDSALNRLSSRTSYYFQFALSLFALFIFLLNVDVLFVVNVRLTFPGFVVAMGMLTGAAYLLGSCLAPQSSRRARLLFAASTLIIYFLLLHNTPLGFGPVLAALLLVLLAPIAIAFRRSPLPWNMVRGFGVVSVLLVLVSVATPVWKEFSTRNAVSGLVDATPRGPVFVLVFDGLSALALADESGEVRDRFDSFLDFSEEAVWIRDAVTNYDHTASSIPSMLSGRAGYRMTLGQATLFDMVEGYYSSDVYGVILNYCDYFPRGSVASCMDSRYFNNATWENDLLRILSLVVARPVFPSLLKIDWIAGLENRGAKETSLFLNDHFFDSLQGADLDNRLFYVHVFSPHAPFIFDRQGISPDAELNIQNFYDATSPQSLQEAFENYLLDAEYADEFLARLTRLLQDSGDWADSTIVLTADHGYSWAWGYQDWGRPTRRDFVNDQIARIPLMIKLPEGRNFEHLADAYQHLDLVPSLLEIMDIPAPEGISLDGASIFKPAPPRELMRVISVNNTPWIFNETSGEWVIE